MDHNQLRDYIRSFSLGNCARGSQGYNRVLLQLFGPTGNGKSAFINSCKFALDGEYIKYADDNDEGNPVTWVRSAYPLTDTVTIVDNRSGPELNCYVKVEICAQLGNFCPLNEAVNWRHSYIEILEMFENMEPNHKDIVVPIYVHSVRKHFFPYEKENVKDFLNTCQVITGIFPIVVLTYKMCNDFSKSEETFKAMGAKVFPLENYTQNNHMATKTKHIDILNVVKCALDDVNFYMESERRPLQEHQERRRVVLREARDVFLEEQRRYLQK